jgi:hypothetical protein
VRVGRLCRALFSLLLLLIAQEAARAQPIGGNPSATPSEIRNPSSINPSAGASDIRNSSAINPGAAASTLGGPSAGGAPIIMRRPTLMPHVRMPRELEEKVRKPRKRATKRSKKRPQAAERAKPAPPKLRTEQPMPAAKAAPRSKAEDKARGIMGNVCRGC